MRDPSGHADRRRGEEVKQPLAVIVLMACSAVALGAEPKAAAFPHVDTPEASIFRGNIVFKNYCILCHGAKADGTGRAAKLYTPKPANLLLSDKNDAYKEMIIRQGGGAIGRSEFMPPWGKELTDEQIKDVVAYLRSISQVKGG
jgi:mono/diheme cytochrome c family protein